MDIGPWLRTLAGCAAMMVMTVTTACGRTQTAAIDEKDALAQLKQVMDGTRICGTLVSATWPIEFSAGALALPSIDALVSAGIVARSPVGVPTGERERVRLLPTAAGKSDVLLSSLQEGSPPQPKLCFGKKRIEAVTIEPGEPSGAGDRQLRYTYRIVAAPSWTGRPDIRAAFPFLDRLLDKPVVAANPVAIRGDRLDLPTEKDAFDDAGLGTHGFFPCPVPDGQPDSPCR
jgi:hypothetical protein